MTEQKKCADETFKYGRSLECRRSKIGFQHGGMVMGRADDKPVLLANGREWLQCKKCGEVFETYGLSSLINHVCRTDEQIRTPPKPKPPKMRTICEDIGWPRGKYNGRKIDGFKVSFHLHLLWWFWRPVVKWNFGSPYLLWLCFSLRGEPAYHR